MKQQWLKLTISLLSIIVIAFVFVWYIKWLNFLFNVNLTMGLIFSIFLMIAEALLAVGIYDYYYRGDK